MYLNNFSVRIIQGRESGGYVELPHNTQYTLSLRNNRSVRCDARIEIDGTHVGTWRLGVHENLLLERPANDTGRFTFYKAGTSEAVAAALDPSSPNLGLVKVIFTPERVVRPIITYRTAVSKGIESEPYTTSYGASSGDSVAVAGAAMSYTASMGESRSAGGTGLSGESNQRFVDVPQLVYDYSQQTEINLRLVCKNGDPRPLTSYSSPVPPPVH